MASDCGSLGNTLQTRGDLGHAEEMYQRALRVNEKLRRLEGLPRDSGYLGHVLRMRGDRAGAKRMYLGVLDTAERLGGPDPRQWARRLLQALPGE